MGAGSKFQGHGILVSQISKNDASCRGQGWLERMYWPWLVQKGHLMPKLTYHLTTIVLILHLCFSTFPKCLFGWRLVISNQVPIPMVQILTLTHYLPYTSSYVLGSCSVRLSSSWRPEKSPYCFRVMAVLNQPKFARSFARPPSLPSSPSPLPPHLYGCYIGLYKCPLWLFVSRLEVIGTWSRQLALQCVLPRQCFDCVEGISKRI